jgi:hypothetical protein
LDATNISCVTHCTVFCCCCCCCFCCWVLLEIFRDYGFVEDYPQRWDLDDDFDIKFDLIEETIDENPADGQPQSRIRLVWVDRPDEKDAINEVKRGLKKELRRLYRVRHLIWTDVAKSGSPTAGLPRREWESIWEYHQAAVNAISYAINELADSEEEKVPVESGVGGDDKGSSSRSMTCTIESCGGDHYSELVEEPDDIRYNKPTCYNRPTMRFPDYFMLEHIKTHYQILNFAFRETDGDICMDLEDTLQICSCYRPHVSI